MLATSCLSLVRNVQSQICFFYVWVLMFQYHAKILGSNVVIFMSRPCCCSLVSQSSETIAKSFYRICLRSACRLHEKAHFSKCRGIYCKNIFLEIAYFTKTLQNFQVFGKIFEICGSGIMKVRHDTAPRLFNRAVPFSEHLQQK